MGRQRATPTAVSAVAGYVLVAVNTSEGFVEPSGHLAVLDVARRRVVATCRDLWLPS
jgi:hypothetical protein